jgi:hypothetical protein
MAARRGFTAALQVSPPWSSKMPRQTGSTYSGLMRAAVPLGCRPMKLMLAFLVWGIMGAVLVTGILLAMKGSVWLLAIALLAFIVLVAKIGCLSH